VPLSETYARLRMTRSRMDETRAPDVVDSGGCDGLARAREATSTAPATDAPGAPHNPANGPLAEGNTRTSRDSHNAR
jgi:hypothetical protein